MVFSTLKRKTRFRIMFPILMSLFLACMVILTVVSRSYFRIYEETAQNYMETKENAVDLFLQVIEETSMQYSFDRTNPTLRLDMLTQSNKSILAAAYFESEDTFFISSKTSGFPTYATLISVPAIQNFSVGGQATMWFLRNDPVAEYYNNKKYDARNGVLTYLRKENDGILMLDIQPAAIFSILENPNKDAGNSTLFDGSLCLCGNPDRLLTKEELSTMQELLSGVKTNADLHGQSARIYRIAVSDSLVATTEISYRYVWNQILLILLVLIPLFLVFFAVTFFVTTLLTNTIIHPLEELQKKMRHEKLLDITHD